MQCKGCKYPNSHVVRVQYDDDRNVITRRRECLRCGLRFTTLERLKQPRTLDDRFPTGHKP
jgi:transcriptional regulator NrdR family protein